MDSTDRLNAAFLDALFDHAPVGLAIMDSDLRFVRVNETLADINGASVEAHIGRSLTEMLPEMPDEVLVAYESVLEAGEPAHSVRLQGETPKAPGVERTWDVSLYPIATDGEVAGLGASVIEVTELVDLEQELISHGEHVYGEIVQSLVIAKVGIEVGGHEPLVRLRVAQALRSAKHLTTEMISRSQLEETGS